MNNFNRRNQSKFSSNLHKKRTLKKLDPSLFIKKAKTENDLQQSHLSEVFFSNFPIEEKLKANIFQHGYKKTTLIQAEAIPPLLEGRDVIGIANTGTGKTAAFLVPLVNKIFKDHNQRALILAPTREIAIQIEEELIVFKRGMNLESSLVIGGANMKRQMQELRHKPHFVIATPGRLRDVMNSKGIDLMLFQNIVLDEVDRMVDIGFIKDIKYFISCLPQKRQSLFFSATVSAQVNEILQSFVHNAVTISTKVGQNTDFVEQDIVKIQGGMKKIDILHDLLIQEGFDKILVFGRTKWGIEKLSKMLVQRGFRAASIHGNKTLGQRKRALDQFKSNEIQVLLATDVASRGIDIDNVTHVINYDAPETEEDYTHRIGRTGRAGRTGFAITFVE